MIRNFFLALIFILSSSRVVLAQDNSSIYDQTKNDITMVALAGVGGAVLGLSTLSFVDKASDHYNNILMGAAVGIVIGVVYVAYNQAMTVDQFKAEQAQAPAIKYEIRMPEMAIAQQKPEPLQMQWNFNF